MLLYGVLRHALIKRNVLQVKIKSVKLQNLDLIISRRLTAAATYGKAHGVVGNRSLTAPRFTRNSRFLHRALIQAVGRLIYYPFSVRYLLSAGTLPLVERGHNEPDLDG